MAGSVGSIYAEASLNIDKFKAAAAQMGGEGAKIAKAMDKAGAGLDKARANLDNFSNNLNVAKAQLTAANAAFNTSAQVLADLQTKAKAAADQAAELGAAYEQAKSSFGETSLMAHAAGQEYQTAAAAAKELAEEVDKQQQKVDKSSVAFEKAAASVKKYESGIKSAKNQIDGFDAEISSLNAQLLSAGTLKAAGSKKSVEEMMRATLSSAGESLGTFAVRAAGGDTTSLLGILSSRGISRGVIALAKGLSATSLGIIGVGAAAAFAGVKIYQAAQKSRDGVDLWEKAFKNVDTERTAKFTQIVDAGIELGDTSQLAGQVNSVYDEIGKALTDGAPDTNAVIKELEGKTKGLYEDVRLKIEEWYNAEMALLNLETPDGLQAAEELTLEYNGLIDEVNALDENTAEFIASYAGKSTAECEAALTQLESYETELERLAGRAEELTTILRSDQAAAYTTAVSGLTTDETTVANATAYVQFDYSTRLRHAEEDYNAQMAELWHQYQTDLNAAAGEQEQLEIEAEYEVKLQQATEGYARTQTELESDYKQMISNVMQGVAEAASRSDPQLAAAIEKAVTGDFSNLKDIKLDNPALAAAMKGFVESGVLDGVTDADLSTAEGQLEAMIRLLAQGTVESAEAAFDKLTLQTTEGVGAIISSIFGKGSGIEEENPAQRISELADQTRAALKEFEQTGTRRELENVQGLFRTGFGYESGGESGADRIVSFINAVAAAADAGNLDTTALSKYSAVIGDLMTVLDSMELYGGTENIAFLSELSSAMNALGYTTTPQDVVASLHALWDAWQPFADTSAEGTITLLPEIKLNEKGIPIPTPEQLAQMGYWDGNEENTVKVPVTLEPWPQMPVAQDMPIQTGGLVAAVETMFANMEAIPVNVPVAATVGGESFAVDYASGIAAATSAVNTAASTISEAAISEIDDGLDDASSIGSDFSAGLASGILAGRSGVISAAASVARAAAAAAKAALDIHSPSGVTMDYGEYFDLGFIAGIKNLEPDVEAAARDALYLEPPSRLLYADQNAPAPAQPASLTIDYERLAEAMDRRRMVLTMDGRRVAEINADNAERARNNRNKSIALGYYGSSGRR